MEGNEGFFVIVPILFITALGGAIATILWVLKNKKEDPKNPPDIV